MAIGVDTSKWKPRKMNGTPAGKFRHYLAAGIVSVGVLIGIAFHSTRLSTNIRKKIEVFYEDPIEVVERKLIISQGITPRTGNTLRKYWKEEEKIDRPDA